MQALLIMAKIGNQIRDGRIVILPLFRTMEDKALHTNPSVPGKHDPIRFLNDF